MVGSSTAAVGVSTVRETAATALGTAIVALELGNCAIVFRGGELRHGEKAGKA